MKQSEKWARGIIGGEFGEFILLDTETTGLGDTDEPCQIAIIDSSGVVLFDSLIKPTIPIGSGAAAVHGISDEDVKDAPTLADVIWQLCDIMDGKLALAYNASFDRSKITRACHTNVVPNPTILCKWDCVMEQYAAFRGEWRRGGYRWQSLTKACRQQGIPVQQAHSALGDALMTLELLRAMAGIREGV